MSTKMEINNMRFNLKYILVCISIFLLVGCSTQPSTNTKSTTQKSANLTADEAKSYQLALDYIKAGETNKAATSLARLSQSHADNLGIWLNLATSYYALKKWDEAIEAINQAQKINANTSYAYNLLGLVNVEKGEYSNAEKNYLKAISLENNYANAHYNLALLYDIDFQDLPKAVSEYEKYLVLVNNTDTTTKNWVSELNSKIKRRGSQ